MQCVLFFAACRCVLTLTRQSIRVGADQSCELSGFDASVIGPVGIVCCTLNLSEVVEPAPVIHLSWSSAVSL